MSEKHLARTNRGYPIQVFPLREGKIQLTTGTITGVTMCLCEADGDIIVTFETGTVETISCVAGRDCIFDQGITSMEIDSGSFSFA